MFQLRILICTFLFLCFFQNKEVLGNNAKSNDVINNFSQILNTNVKKDSVRTVNIDSILKANINLKDKLLKKGDIYFPYESFQTEFEDSFSIGFVKGNYDDDFFCFISLVKEIDEKGIVPEVNVYMLKDKTWKLINTFKGDTVDCFYLETQDLNNDGNFEIWWVGHPNMNGNWLNKFYTFSKEKQTFVDGGGFFSSIYEFFPKKSRIEVEYGGSWYMPISKTIYYWKNNKLIPYKEVEIALKKADMKHEARFISYSENIKLDKDKLELKFKMTYKGTKLESFYENFFRNN